MTKPRIRVKAEGRAYYGLPDDAQPGDLLLGNRGAAAVVVEYRTSGPQRLRSLNVEYAGNFGMGAVRWPCGKIHDRR